MAKKKTKPKKKTKSKRTKLYLVGGLCFLIFLFYYTCLKPNINIRTDYCYFYIPSNATDASVYDSLKAKNLLKSNLSFWIVEQAIKVNRPPKGLYQLNKGWGNFWLIMKLREGNQKDYFSYQIPEYKSRNKTIKSICKQAGVNLKEFKQVLKDSIFLAEALRLNPESIYCIFLPGKYRTYSNRSSQDFLKDIYSEYNLFWNEERVKLARNINCTPEDVIKLASIVYAETKNTTEMPVIAGTYLNRLKKNMHLQADPTLLFASNAFHRKRVYFKHINTPSLYNTYKHKGLPPGPIGPAPFIVIEAVLHAQKHNYLYFCAKGDESGCHYFSESFEEHKENARRYRSLLDRKKIK